MRWIAFILSLLWFVPAHAQELFPIQKIPTAGFRNLCSATAQPPPAAARAGYTKLAFCEDFSDPKYGVISDWIDCNQTGGKNSGTGKFPQYDYWIWTTPYGGCNDFSQTIDPSTGLTTMLFHWHSDVDPGQSQSETFLGLTDENAFAGNPLYDNNVPDAGYYFEIRYRSTKINDFILASFPVDSFTYCENEPTGSCPIYDENDNPESYGGRDGSATVPPGLNWTNSQFPNGGVNGNGCCGAGSATFHGPIYNIGLYWGAYCTVTNQAGCPRTELGIDPNTQTTYGWLNTTDGTNKQMCAYFNDQHPVSEVPDGGPSNACFELTPTTCPGCTAAQQAAWPGNLAAMLKSRMHYGIWLGDTYGKDTYNCKSYTGNGNYVVPDGNTECVDEGGQPDTYTYIEFVRFWTCQASQQFYVPSTGTVGSTTSTAAYDTNIPCKSGLIQ